MTYQNRLLTTPMYINEFDSVFWKLIAKDTAMKTQEACAHAKNLFNINVECVVRGNKCRVYTHCKRCNLEFPQTNKVLVNMIGYFGF